MSPSRANLAPSQINNVALSKKMYVEKNLDNIYFYIRKNSATKYLRYNFVHNNTVSNNSNIWRLDNVFAGQFQNGVFVPSFEVCQDLAEWEMALQIVGRPDFIGGGYHGDEIQTMSKLYHDGIVWDTTNNTNLLSIPTSSTNYNGLSISSTPNSFSVSGTATAGTYIRLDGILQALSSSSGLGAKNYTLPGGNYRISLTATSFSITGGTASLNIRKSDNSGNLIQIPFVNGINSIVGNGFNYVDAGAGALYLYVPSGAVINFNSTITLNPVFVGSLYCDRLKFVVQSNLYDPTDSLTQVGTHIKSMDITVDGIDLYQEIKWLGVYNLNYSFISMLPINRGNDARVPSMQVTDTVYDNGNFNEYDVSVGGFTTYPNQYKTGVTKYNIYGKPSKVSAEMEIISQTPVIAAAASYMKNVVDQYNKIYFDMCGNSYTTANNEVWKVKSRFALNIID